MSISENKIKELEKIVKSVRGKEDTVRGMKYCQGNFPAGRIRR